jgi:hypothetical protein
MRKKQQSLNLPPSSQVNDPLHLFLGLLISLGLRCWIYIFHGHEGSGLEGEEKNDRENLSKFGVALLRGAHRGGPHVVINSLKVLFFTGQFPLVLSLAVT